MSTLLPGFDPEQLLQRGYTRYRVDHYMVTAALEEYKSIIETFRHQPPEARAFTRNGEDEPDLGLICKDGSNGTDEKCYFHYAVDLPERGAKGLRGCRMSAIDALYHANNRAVAEAATMLTTAYPDLFPASIVDELAKAGLYPAAYSTNVLRGLYYPKKNGGNQRQGAKAHFDRDFLSQHFGGIGGDFVAYKEVDDNVGKVVSLHLGEVLVFGGVKVMDVTKGAVKPLRHGSVTEPGEDRWAMVQFCHTECAVPVISAEVAYAAYNSALV